MLNRKFELEFAVGDEESDVIDLIMNNLKEMIHISTSSKNVAFSIKELPLSIHRYDFPFPSNTPDVNPPYRLGDTLESIKGPSCEDK